jgi:hypothetical protein
MENSGLAFLIGGVIVTIFLVMGGTFNLRRLDTKAMKADDSMAAIGFKVWSYLTPAQQEELKEIDSLFVQEQWVEEHVEPSVLNGVSAERILIEFANRGFIQLGRGVFRRHASPLDFIEPEARILEVSEAKEAEETTTPEEEVTSETAAENSSEGETEQKLPVILVAHGQCCRCTELSTELSKATDPEVKITPENKSE